MPRLGINAGNPMIITETPGSEAILRIGYNPVSSEMSILFRGKEEYPEYVYSGVDPKLALEFLTARSKGRFYHSRIKNNTGIKVNKAFGNFRLGLLGNRVKQVVKAGTVLRPFLR